MSAETFSIRDIGREPVSEPCPDCGRTYLQGERVTVTVPTPTIGYRDVWSGCCDCWVRRTDPAPFTDGTPC